ncbi:hypothetical protein LAZ67_14003314 [Cordylochernes scorpioides]|uniref:Transposase n=1 Tax=Cordylochernes scorpioides TaxID=51811 RepID=A0ABY6L7I0_9ARAC|nr:hypothetical protein LAZ67_14003314 [Cordylochernes scorpioides]
MKRAIRSRAVQRTTISKMIKRVEAELDEETPSETTIRMNYKLLEKHMASLQDEDKLIWELMLDDEENDDKATKVGTRAKRLVKSYPLTEDNYPKVIEALRDRFGDKVILTEVYVRQLLKLVINNKEHRKEMYKNRVELFITDPHWLKNVITGYETRVYGYDPETKRQSSQWLEPGEPRFKKARMIKSKLKCLHITFFDVKGLVLYEFVPEGQNINQNYYLDVLRRLREAVHQK